MRNPEVIPLIIVCLLILIPAIWGGNYVLLGFDILALATLVWVGVKG